MELNGTIKQTDFAAEELHHAAVMYSAQDLEFPIGVGLCDHEGKIKYFVKLDLQTAHEFGTKFAERFNQALDAQVARLGEE